MDLIGLLYRPSAFFASFDGRSASRALALGAFLLLAVVEGYGELVAADASQRVALVPGVALNGLLKVVVFGVVWFYVGARVVGGTASLDTTVKAVGYAFFWPALIAVATVALLEGSGPQSTDFVLLSIGLRVLLGILSIVLAALAVRHVHRLSIGRTLAVVLWFPVALIGVALAADRWAGG